LQKQKSKISFLIQQKMLKFQEEKNIPTQNAVFICVRPTKHTSKTINPNLRQNRTKCGDTAKTSF